MTGAGGGDAPSAVAEAAGRAAIWLLAGLLLSAALALPEPTLFDAGWDERELFLDDLRPAFREEALALEAAPVYHLRWTLDDAVELSARQEVWIENAGSSEWQEIYFHLLPNLLGGTMTVAALRVDGQPVEPALEDDGRLLRVGLAGTLSPGEAAVVALDYRLTVPTGAGRNYGILGHRQRTLSLAHAYALLAVHEDGAWDLERPPGHGDLVYARSSFFLVEVEAPAELYLVASGRELSNRVEGERRTVRFAAGPVRDFYLIADPDLEPVEALVDGIVVRGHAQPGSAGIMEEVVEQASRSLELFGRLYGGYPYGEFDIVVISTSALGVEFPGVIALRRQLLSPRDGGLLESTVVHEVAHQWFYGVVGNDQVGEPWLDEALSQYLTLRYFRAIHGVEGYRAFREGLVSRWEEVGRRRMPIGKPVAAYTVGEYGAIVYGLGPLVVEWLAGLVGRPRFDGLLADYVRRHRFGLVDTVDFRSLAEEHCGCSLADFFEEWVDARPDP